MWAISAEGRIWWRWGLLGRCSRKRKQTGSGSSGLGTSNPGLENSERHEKHAPLETRRLASLHAEHYCGSGAGQSWVTLATT